MVRRKWLTLPAALMWAMTRNAELTETVQTDPEAYKNVALRIALRFAAEKVVEGQAIPKYFDHVSDAWLAIRDLIADEKLSAEGPSVERRGLQSAIELYCSSAPIPSGEAGNLVMLDDWGGFTETVLGPDETYRFQNGQGRYWKRVRLRATDLLAAFPPPLDDKAGNASGVKQRRLDPFDRPHWSLAMGLGWIAAWLAMPTRTLEEARTIVWQLSPASSDTFDVCRYALHNGSDKVLDYPTDACERLTSAGGDRRFVATGIPFGSVTEIREEIPYTCWQGARILPTTHGTSRRRVLALFAGISPLYRDILLPTADVRALWQIGGPLTAEPEVPSKNRNLSPQFQKIQSAIDAERAAGGRIDGLKPKERNKRLYDRMEEMGYKRNEMPDPRTLREFFNKGPGKTEKDG